MKGVTINDTPALTARLTIPGTGPWLLDVDLDLDAKLPLPSGRAVLTVGDETLVGTVDPRATGRIGASATVQVVAGGNGWDKPVDGLHIHNDFGVTSTTVYSVTAAKVGEVVVDAAPRALGPDYVRSAGPASRVLRGVSWYVDAAGVTHVGPRPVRPGTDLRILEWDPLTRRVVLAADGVVWPGTVLTDSRFGTARIRDVEQSFTTEGARALAWCDAGPGGTDVLAGNRLARALGALAGESVGLPYLRRYAYRIVQQGPDGRLTLQAVTRAAGAPEALQLVSVWPGAAGVSHQYVPGSLVHVAFVAGDPSKPVVVAFATESPRPLVTTIDAERVEVGDGSTPAVLASSSFAAWVASVTSTINGLTTPTTIAAPTGFTSTRLFSE